LARNLLLLLGRALVSIVFVVISWVRDALVTKQSFQCLHELCLLIFDFFIVSVARKVNILSLLVFLRSGGTFFAGIVFRIEWIFLVEFVKAGAVFIVIDFGLERSLLVSKTIPVKPFKKGMGLDLFDSVSPQPVVSVTEQLFQNIFGSSTQIGIVWDVKSLFPV
jgi:hypothetical protein